MNVLEGQRNEPQSYCNRIILCTSRFVFVSLFVIFRSENVFLLSKFNRNANEKDFLSNPVGCNIKPECLK